MAAGDADVLAAARPALEPFSGLIVHVGGPGMGQVVKLCNNLIYAAQMLATAEATVHGREVRASTSRELYEVLTHATGDCVAVRTRLPAEGVVADSPASNGWQPGFMTDLMAKDLDLAIGYAAEAADPAVHRGAGPPDPGLGERSRLRARGLLGAGQGRARARRDVTVLTVDLGTSATKAALWSGGDLVALVRVPVATTHPAPGYAEQNPDDWWRSVVEAYAILRGQAPDAYGQVDTVGCSAAGDVRLLRRRPATVDPRDPLVRHAGDRRGTLPRRPDRVPPPDRRAARTGVLRGEDRVDSAPISPASSGPPGGCWRPVISSPRS